MERSECGSVQRTTRTEKAWSLPQSSAIIRSYSELGVSRKLQCTVQAVEHGSRDDVTRGNHVGRLKLKTTQ